MPFKSSKQRAWMYINKPGLAKEWTKKYGGKVKKKLSDELTKKR